MQIARPKGVVIPAAMERAVTRISRQVAAIFISRIFRAKVKNILVGAFITSFIFSPIVPAFAQSTTDTSSGVVGTTSPSQTSVSNDSSTPAPASGTSASNTPTTPVDTTGTSPPPPNAPGGTPAPASPTTDQSSGTPTPTTGSSNTPSDNALTASNAKPQPQQAGALFTQGAGSPGPGAVAVSFFNQSQFKIDQNTGALAQGTQNAYNNFAANPYAQTVVFGAAFVMSEGAYGGGGSALSAEEEEAATTPETLYHYTSKKGLEGILEDQAINPSEAGVHGRMGAGQYFTNIAPEQVNSGEMSPYQVSRSLFGSPVQSGNRLQSFVQIDVSGLNLQQSPNSTNIYYLPNNGPLDISGRIISSGPTNFNF